MNKADVRIETKPEYDDGLQGDMTLSWHLVVYVDLLGQTEKLRQLTALPKTPDEFARTLQILRETAGLTLRFRDLFNDFFTGFNAHEGNTDKLPPGLASIAREMRKAEVHYRGFSDSVIIDVPIGGNDEHCKAVNGIYACLLALSGMFTEMLAVGVPIRAGLDVGLAIDIAEGELYGPALARAYTLESKVAKWPRLVVGTELVSFLGAVVSSRSTTPRGGYARGMAQACRSLLMKDEDGCTVVNYLSPRFKEFGVGVRKEALDGAMKFADFELERFRQDDKLRPRYESLQRFLREGASFWLAQGQQE